MRILYVTTIAGSMVFFPDLFRSLITDGHTIELACNCEQPLREDIASMNMPVHDIPFSRSTVSKRNFDAYRQLKKVIINGKFDIVHCHTPNAAVITRFVCRKLRKQGLKVFYTAHGFHFYKGAPLKNWLIYYPVERLCARWTDTLITINQEDYALARKKMKAKNILYVPGVGIDLAKFNKTIVNRSVKRKELGVSDDTVMLLSVGELNENKNHETVIRAITEIKNICYIVAGNGELQGRLTSLIDSLGLSDRVQLLGYRDDIGELCAAADAFVFPSFREGLSVALMEAMASGLPVVCSRIRGNTDLIDENGGVMFDPHSVEDCKSAIIKLIDSDINRLGAYNTKKICTFSIDSVIKQMTELLQI